MSISNKTFLALVFFALFLFSCSGKGGLRENAKLNQYMVQGMKLYRQHCSNCHQVDGSGLARLIPPLKDSDYLQKLEPGELACQIRYGLKGEITVNGVIFNQEMPGIPQLKPLEIAEIVTYVKNTWSEDGGLYNVKEAERALEACAP